MSKMDFDFNADPKWKEHYEEKRKYEVWELFFHLKIIAGVWALAGVAWIIYFLLLVIMS